jgi:oligopeptide transport system substrate-binding protein
MFLRRFHLPPIPFRLASLTFLLACALWGCRREAPADLVLHNGREPETIDPHLLTGQADGRIGGSLFEGLTRFDPVTASAIPGLAEGWKLSADGRVYTFQIRTNAAWSTGEPITAEDFVWSWRRAVNPQTAADYASQYFYVKQGEAIYTGREKDLTRLGVRALGPQTLEVELNEPTPFFLELLASRVFMVVPRRTLEQYGDQWIRARPLPCSGPYTLESWRVNDHIRLRRNPHYWDAAHVESEVIDVLAGDSAHTALNLYLAGDVDFIIDKDMFPAELSETLRQRADFHRYDYLGCYFIRMNCTRKPFDDPRVRRALALVVDRQRIVERITRMGERPTTHLVPAGTGGYTPPAGLERDIAAAKRSLAEAGFPGGQGFRTFEYSFNAESKLHEQIAVELQAMFREHLGLRMELHPLEWKTYLADMSGQNYDLMRSSWIGDYNDPNTFLDLFLSQGGNNRTGWKDLEYDRLVEAANRTPDRTARFALLSQAESRLVREGMPVIPLYSYVGFYALDTNRVAGVYPNLLDEHPFWPMKRLGPQASAGRR